MRAPGLFGLCLFLAAGPVLACDDSERCIGVGESYFGLAVGVGELDNPLVAAPNTRFYTYPQFAWYGERWYFDNGDLGYTLVDDGHWLVNLTTGLAQDSFYFQDWGGNAFTLPLMAISRTSYDGLEDPAASQNEVVIVGERKLNMPHAWALLAGPEVQYFAGPHEVAMRALRDVSGVHDGSLVNLRYAYHLRLGDWSVTSRLGLDWKSRRLNDHYYSVSPEDNPLTYLGYRAGASIDRIFQLYASYPLTPNWRVLVQGEYRRLGADVANSPRVAERNLGHYFLGVGYSF